MTRLLLVRHGESEANVAGSFAGWTDVHLTEKGRAQAAAAAAYMTHYPIDAAYASDLSRAYETARCIADRQNVKVMPDKGLREIYAGDWEGRSYAELLQKYPEQYTVWLQDIGHAVTTNGESVAALQARVKETIDRILREHRGQTVLIGTHATPIRVMECIWRDVALENACTVAWCPNASTTVVEYDDTGKVQIVLRGHCAYLGDLLTELPKNV